MTLETAPDLTWDIDTLVDGLGEQGVVALLDESLQKAKVLSEHRGQIADFDAERLAEFMQGIGEVMELAGRAGSYARLAFSADTQDPKHGALLQMVEERGTEISTLLLFFELEWAAVDDEKSDALLRDPKLGFAAHYLKVLRESREHLLSEPEERILAEKAVTARSAWRRLFNDLTSQIDVELDGERTTLQQALARTISPDREVRCTAAQAVTAALQPGLQTRAYIYNMLLQDKATDDRLRGYEHWLQSFNISQQASDASVEALVSAVRQHYGLARRWYTLKAKALGVDKLAYYDRSAPVLEDEEEVEWDEARDTVLDCYSAFSERAGAEARRFFDERWIDVPPRPGKVTGAFCAPTVSSHHPYVLLNYTGRRNDVLTLAHELGHGLHQSLGRKQGAFHHTTPLTVAETASVFGETIVFNRLLETADSPRSRFSLLAQKVESAIATIFRQVAMNSFEARVHNARRSEGELGIDRFGALWIETQVEMLEDTVDLGEDYRTWWSYIPHFIDVPGYVYAYAFGNLLAISVYARYEQQGPGFVDSYLQMLEAGGSKSPEDLARMVDCDLTDKSFWEQGLALVERDITLAEEAAASAGFVSQTSR
jgi:oligoendopeptidase F